MLLPLRLAIPLILLAVAVLMGIFTYWDNSRHSLQLMREETATRTNQRLTQLQGTLELLLQIDALDKVQSEIASVGADPTVQHALLIDDHDNVLAAAQRKWIGAPAGRAMPTFSRNDATRVNAALDAARIYYRGSTFLLSDANALASIYPVVMGRNIDDVRPTRRGIVFVLQDLESVSRHTREHVVHQSAQSSIFVAGVALLLWALSHATVTRRVNRLLQATTRLARGDFEARASLRGRDEIAQIATAFDRMAADLQSDHAALEAQEEHIRLLLDSTAEAIVGVDLEGRCTFCNPATLRLLGYDDAGQLLGRMLHDVCHHSLPDGSPLPQSCCPICMAFAGEQSHHTDDAVFWRADGSSFPVEYWAYPVRKNGRMVGGVIAFLDITQRKRAEESLFEEKERAQVTLHSIGDAVITTDTAGLIEYMNPVAEHLTGWPLCDARGRHLTEVFYVVDETTGESPPFNIVERCIHEGNIIGLANHTALIDREGRAISIEDSAAPIRDRARNIIGIVIVFHDVSEARELAQRLSWQASHDALTGLINRREFENRIRAALQTARDANLTHCLLYVDLDQFKIVNDTCGHVAGDELLKQLAALIMGRMRETDTLARLGGDEFGVLLEGCHAVHALRIAESLCHTVHDFRFVWEGKTFDVGASIGLVEINATNADLANVLSRADMACYMAKDAGRNRVHLYQESDRELVRRRGEMQWVSRLTQALERNELVLYGQTIVPLHGGAGEQHCEVLLRLRDESGRIIPPGAFIPAAERYNLMPALDRWVIDSLFAALGQNRIPCTGGRYAVNLSGATINDPAALDFIRGRFDKHGVSPRSICFEITETAAIAHLPKAVGFIEALKSIGCQFALDDFGSGVSSFAYLKNLPVDYLKIDGSFVRDLAIDPIDLEMVDAINRIGHVMGLKTIAEFVENDDILAELRRLGVDFAQGYGLQIPQPLWESTQG